MNLGINMATINDAEDLQALRNVNAALDMTTTMTVIKLSDAIVLLRHYNVSQATIIALQEHNRYMEGPKPSARNDQGDRQPSVLSGQPPSRVYGQGSGEYGG